MKDKKILLVGCGKMGGALLQGMLNAGVLTRNIIVIDPNTEYVKNNFNIRTLKEFQLEEIENLAPDIIILAVKPQIIASILPNYSHFSGRSLFISIVAGKTTAFFEKHLGNNAAIIRTMPNLPVIVSKGVTVFFSNNKVNSTQSDSATSLFGSIGDIHHVYEESLIDAVTAISGSGPAYVFHFIECMIEAAVKLGLQKKLADKIVYKTIEGSIALASNEYKTKSATELRHAVTSPAGTTEAALKILMEDNKMGNLLSKAINAANLRSKELSE